MIQDKLQAELDDADVRLLAAERARQLVEEARRVLQEAGVRNGKVLDSTLAAQSEIAQYKRSTKFIIRKRQERLKKCRPSIN